MPGQSINREITTICIFKLINYLTSLHDLKFHCLHSPMRHLLLSAFLLLILSPAWSQTKSNNISFYFSANPDDWQLFMGVNALKDIAAASTGNGNKVVFIYTTAGEANCSGAGVDKDYYLSRQEGAIRSTQFC